MSRTTAAGFRLFAFLMMSWFWLEHIQYANTTEKERYIVTTVGLLIVSATYATELFFSIKEGEDL